MIRPLMSKTQNICLILLSILFILLAVIIVNQIITNKKEVETEYKKINIEKEKVNIAVESWNINFCEGIDSLISKMYSGDFQYQDINATEKLYLALKKINHEFIITTQDLNNNLKKIIDDELTEEDIKEVINSGNLNNLYDLSYNKQSLTFNKKEFVCSDNKHIITKIMKAEENEEYLNIYVKFAYGLTKVNDEEINVIDYYKDLDAKKFVERVVKEDKGKVNWENYDIYKFTFKIDEENYLLKTITKN